MNLSRNIAQVSLMISSRNYNPFLYCVFCIDFLVVVEFSILTLVNGVKNIHCGLTYHNTYGKSLGCNII